MSTTETVQETGDSNVDDLAATLDGLDWLENMEMDELGEEEREDDDNWENVQLENGTGNVLQNDVDVLGLEMEEGKESIYYNQSMEILVKSCHFPVFPVFYGKLIQILSKQIV